MEAFIRIQQMRIVTEQRQVEITKKAGLAISH